VGAVECAVVVVVRPNFAANSLEVRPLCSIAALHTALVLSRSPGEAVSPAARRAVYLVTHSLARPARSGVADSLAFGCSVVVVVLPAFLIPMGGCSPAAVPVGA